MRGDAVTAGLVPGEGRGIQQHHAGIRTELQRAQRRGAARWSGAEDEQVHHGGAPDRNTWIGRRGDAA